MLKKQFIKNFLFVFIQFAIQSRLNYFMVCRNMSNVLHSIFLQRKEEKKEFLMNNLKLFNEPLILLFDDFFFFGVFSLNLDFVD